MHLWLMLRLMLPADPGAALLSTHNNLSKRLVALWIYVSYFEFTVKRLSTLLLNHTVLFLIFLTAGDEQTAPITPLVSVVMIVMFCFRRSHPSITAEAEDVIEKMRLLRLIAKVGKTVQLVLESGDALCTESRELLQQALTMMNLGDVESSSFHDLGNPCISCDSSHARHSDLTSKSRIGRGGGVGILEKPTIGQSDEELLADFIKMDDMEIEADVPTAIFTEPWHQDAPPPPPTAAVLRDSPPFAGQLMSMCSDALAQVDPGTRTLLWRNQQFDQLAEYLGSGNSALGQRILSSEFLQQCHSQEHRAECQVG
eukprot:TRINITY_DN3853_c0_g1_i10.p1 TRINITY_DN3853_c0_g1~~TRINITY_DN3853_c0_g1_i10.p1  ORF type:complete len:313 (-),score=68.81 TRINITY_DN3853_c0_g1_i10:201-1139(-)